MINHIRTVLYVSFKVEDYVLIILYEKHPTLRTGYSFSIKTYILIYIY